MLIRENKIEREVARAFEPLLPPRRYKGAFGGRGGAKSHFFAEGMVLQCFAAETRAVCVREVQLSLADSVHQLLVDKIHKFNLASYFTITERYISASTGSHIIFRGMNSYTAETIKSLEGYDLAWVEEAQTLSQHSLNLLRPTIRKPGSEIWASWNPRHRTDPMDVFFRKRPLPPDQMISVMVNWRDNPWFPEVLEKDRVADMIADPEQAEHVWEGAYGATQGAILARLVDRAEREGRIHDEVDFDPRGPGIEITSDIGFRDTATWWFWQRRLGGFVLVDAMGDSGVDADDWAVVLSARCRDRGYRLDKIWLPKDAKARTMASKHSVQDRFRKFFGPAMVKIVPKTSVADRINAGRTIIKMCHFHKTNCEAGLEHLRAWQFEYNPETEAFSREPLHDAHSHWGDGFSYGAQVMQGLEPEPEDVEPNEVGPNTHTIMELMKSQPKKSRRI